MQRTQSGLQNFVYCGKVDLSIGAVNTCYINLRHSISCWIENTNRDKSNLTSSQADNLATYEADKVTSWQADICLDRFLASLKSSKWLKTNARMTR